MKVNFIKVIFKAKGFMRRFYLGLDIKDFLRIIKKKEKESI